MDKSGDILDVLNDQKTNNELDLLTGIAWGI